MNIQQRLKDLGLDVSRETWVQLEAYVEILLKWQKAINLIGPATVDDVWSRHILDSAQLLPYRPGWRRKRLADTGFWRRLPRVWFWRCCGPTSISC